MMTLSFRSKILILSFFWIFITVFSCMSGQKNNDVDQVPKTETAPISVESSRFLENKVQKVKLSGSRDNLAIATWNIQHLGQSKSDDEILFMAEVLRDFDIVAIQEVVAKHPAGAQKVAQLADELNRKGASWDYRISDPTKSPSVYISERYAFLWKTSKVELLGRAYLDQELETQINREPYIGKFRFKKMKQEFYVINFHSRTHKDHPELEIMHFKDYPKRLNLNTIIIAGDFNLNERHPVWDDLYQQGYNSSVRKAKTTLKRKCQLGSYLSHDIDNIYYSKAISFINSGVVDYIGDCENLEAARKISDHLPVFLEFGMGGH